MSEMIVGWGVDTPAQGMGFVQSNDKNTSMGAPECLILDDSESHALVIAPTGAGKGRNFIIPNLLTYEGPAIVVDVKGEAAAVTARHRSETLGQKVVVIDPWGKSGLKRHAFNPIDYLAGDPDNIGDNAYTLASMISGRQRHGSLDPFWDERAEALIAGFLADFATSPDIGRRSLGALWEKASDGSLVWQLNERASQETLHPFARTQYEGFFGIAADGTRSGIQAVALSHIRAFAGEAVQRATERTDFALADVVSGAPLTIYLVVPPSRLKSHAGLLRVWLAALIGLVTERASRPEKPTLLMIDELAHLGPLEPVRQSVTLARGYGLRCALFLQSYAQMRQVYPEDHETVMENCGLVCTFGHTSMTMSRQMADALGDVSPQSLYRLGAQRLAVRFAGGETQILRRLDYLRDDMFCGRFSPNPMFRPERTEMRRAA
jgi:type IV secretion system protein VirD4